MKYVFASHDRGAPSTILDVTLLALYPSRWANDRKPVKSKANSCRSSIPDVNMSESSMWIIHQLEHPKEQKTAKRKHLHCFTATPSASLSSRGGLALSMQLCETCWHEIFTVSIFHIVPNVKKRLPNKWKVFFCVDSLQHRDESAGFLCAHRNMCRASYKLKIMFE